MTISTTLQAGRSTSQRALSIAVATLGPLMVFAVLIRGGEVQATKAVEVLAGVVIIAVVASRPVRGLIVLLAYLPLQPVLLPGLFRIGAPAPLVRGLGAIPTAIVAGLVVRAFTEWKNGGRRLDLVDKLALSYVAIATFYLVLPVLDSSVFSQTTAPTTLTVRFLAWRLDTLYVIVLIAARRLHLEARAKRAIVILLLLAAAIVAGCAFVEEFSSHTWNTFLVSTVQVPQYDLAILHQNVDDPKNLLSHSLLHGHDILRVGSVLRSPLVVGFYLITAVGVGLHRLTSRRFEPLVALVIAASAATIVFTVTRDAVLTALIAALVSFLQGLRRQSPGRVRVGIGLVALAILAAPFAAGSTLGQRTTATQNEGQDTQAHKTSSLDAYHDIFFVPLGRGLGTSAAVGSRFGVVGTVTTENAYLQVGDELGITAMVVFIAMYVAVLAGLLRAPPDPFLSPDALFAAGLGLAVGGMFLQIWLDYPTAITFWSIAGIALGAPGSRPAASGRSQSASGHTVAFQTKQLSER